MATSVPEDLPFELANAGRERLEELVESSFDHFDLPAVRALLSNAYCDEKVVQRIYRERRLISSYEVRRELARHRSLPLALVLQLVPGLYWRDLIALCQDTRIRPQARRAAELRLIERLPGLAVGERMHLARKASPRLVQALGRDPNPRVCQALLENPRLTEGQIMPWISRDNSNAQILRVVARNPRWGVRYPIRVALCSNPKTPVDVALSLLPHLKRADQLKVGQDRRLPPPVRRRAELLSGAASR
ncbi:MAG: hypothetical protein K8J08_18250 [Thermoanaerobaculia bacterium]|nr:hypothetical protein [Thermoanaerobaculia bacterium]